MANLFVLNLAGTVAPVDADNNCNALIDRAAGLMGSEPAAPVEVPDLDAERMTLFGRVAAQEITADEAVAALKALTDAAKAAAAAAKAEPAILLLAGEPASRSEIKRAFRGAESGTSVEVASLDGTTTGAITMFRV